MIGRSPAFRRVLALIDRIAAYDAPVLVEGETGTGKELAARAIHGASRRRDRPFVPVNCGALPDALIENELFGHRRGAFTDARDDQAGVVTLAHGGTLFLDEIDALSPRAQIALLRFLQDYHYRPLGGPASQRVDVRIIAATRVDLESLVAAGQFRSDLLYRLDVMRLRVPALRERAGDVMLLAEHFLEQGSARFNCPKRAFDAETMAWFDRHHWPGNVRELENTVYRGLLLADDGAIHIESPCSTAGAEDNLTALSYRQAKARAMASFELRFLRAAMTKANGSVTTAARLVGTERRHLGRLLKKHGLRH